jgi:hypothetical protein
MDADLDSIVIEEPSYVDRRADLLKLELLPEELDEGEADEEAAPCRSSP